MYVFSVDKNLIRFFFTFLGYFRMFLCVCFVNFLGGILLDQLCIVFLCLFVRIVIQAEECQDTNCGEVRVRSGLSAGGKIGADAPEHKDLVTEHDRGVLSDTNSLKDTPPRIAPRPVPDRIPTKNTEATKHFERTLQMGLPKGSTTPPKQICC